MLFDRRPIVSLSVVAASLVTTLLIDDAFAQSVSAPATTAPATTAPATTAPATTAPILPQSPTAPATTAPMLPQAADSTASNGGARATESDDLPPADVFAGESVLTAKDRVVLKPPAYTRWLLIGAGLATTGAWYGASYGIGAIWKDAPGRNDLKIPVAGPFMDLAHTGCPKGDSGCSKLELVVRTILVGLDAIGQAGGVALVLEGALFSPSGIEPPRAGQSVRLPRRVETPSVMAVPWTDGQTGAGLGLVGRF